MRMPTPTRVWVSAFLVCAGIVLFLAYRHWFATRTWVAVDTPISLAPGHVRIGDFHVNQRATYGVVIQFQEYEYWRHPECQDYQVLQTRWWLSRGGRVTSTWKDSWNNSEGAPDSPLGGSYLGAFDGDRGRYDLDVEIAPGAGCLQQFHPRLRVYADDTDYAGGGWVFATVFLASWLLVGAGGGLLLVGWAAPFPVDVSRGESLAIFDTLRARRVSSRRKLLLMGPASILPTVAYLYATTFFLLFLVVAPLQLSRFARSRGIPARLLRADVIQASMDQSTTGLLVFMDRSGNLYLNSKRETAAQLERALEKEFGLRADWSVYVEADPDLPYQTVVQAMDMVRTAHGKVIILTPATRAETEAARH